MILSKLTALLLSSTLLTGCGALEASSNETEKNLQQGETEVCQTHIVDYSSNDSAPDWQSSSYTTITLNDASASVSGSGAQVSGGDITISSAGTYVLQGTLTNGTVTVDAAKEDLVYIVLNGVSVTSSDYAPLYIKQADKAVLVLADGTQNSLTDGEVYTYLDTETDEPNAAIFSKDDLTITGNGSLTVNARFNNGIRSKDDLKITGGTLSVTAADDGLVGKDLVGISGGVISIQAQGDGIKSAGDTDVEKGFIRISGGELQITSAGDGMQAVSCIHYDGGSLDMNTGGGSAAAAPHQETGFGRQTASLADASEENTASTKGLKADHMVTISGGSIHIDSQDDAVHSNNAIFITDGALYLTTGDDGIHADTTLSISGGSIHIPSCYEGLESSSISISGGDINLTASDDGINAAGGEDEEPLESQSPSQRQDMQTNQSSYSKNDQFTQPPEGIPFQDRGNQPPDGEAPPDGMTPDNFGENEQMPPTRGGQPGGMGHSNGNNALTISGGTVYVNASGDGIDSNGSITMTGGTLLVDGPEGSGNGALDYDGSFTLSGGTLIAAGSSGMMQAPSDTSTQNTVVVLYSSTQAAGTNFQLNDANGNELLHFTPMKRYQSIIVSSPALLQGTTYSISSNGTKLTDFTLDSTISYISESGVTTTPPGMGGGSMPGGNRPSGGMGGGRQQKNKLPATAS